jgi:hypothetical protein
VEPTLSRLTPAAQIGCSAPTPQPGVVAQPPDLGRRRAPARLIPGSREHAGSMSSCLFTTRHQRIASARLPDPHLTRHARPFHIAHHDRVTAPTPCGGLKALRL